MADPLSVAASAVAFVQIADRLLAASKRFIDDIRDAPGDIRHIHTETEALKELLATIKLDTLPNQDALKNTIAMCSDCLGSLLDLLPPIPAGFNSAHARKRQRLSWSALKWTWRKSAAFALLARLAQHKATILVAISEASRYV